MLCSLNDAADFLSAHDNYRILTHRRPDGDTVGSAVALCRILRALGKTAWIWQNPEFTPKFAPYLADLVAPDGLPSAQATYVAVDVATRSLFPFGAEDAAVALCIDHHGTNSDYAGLTYAEPKAAACGELIWALRRILGVAPDRAICEAVYIAVSTDTGCFRYSNVTANTLRVAADCVENGAQIYPINRVMFETKRWPRLQLERYLIEHTQLLFSGTVAVSAIPRQLMDELSLTEDDVDDIAGFGRNIEGVEIGVMLREVEGGRGKISVRTSPSHDAAAICRRIGGGGHPAAAGATVEGGIEAARRAVLDAIAAQEQL